ncbi:MAG: rhodanese-like domain-containing protein [Bacteroidota bacterium]
MKQKYLFSFSLFFFLGIGTTNLVAQEADAPRIEKKGYDKMLKTLLDHSVNEVSVKEAAALREEAVFLDAREPAEYKVSHIEDAKFIGYEYFSLANVKDIPKDKKIIVYCSVGYRSEKISEKLLEAGFKDVSNLYGGIFEWKNQDQEVVDEKGATEKVHAYDHIWGFWLKEGEKVY